MPIDIFLDAVKQLAEKRLSALDAIGTAEHLNTSGRLDLTIQLYRLWVGCTAADPLLHVVNYNLGMALSAAGDPAGAGAALEAALAIDADFHPARLNLGVVTAGRGAIDDALDHWREVVARLDRVNPDTLRFKKIALRNLAYHFELTNRFTEAEDALRQSLALDPHQTDVAQHLLSSRQEQCIWPLATTVDGLSREALVRTMLPLSLAAWADDPILQLATAWSHARSVNPSLQRVEHTRAHVAEATPRRRRIGYMSSDLRAHAVGSLVPEVFERHDRSAFEVFAYSFGPPSTDSLANRLRGAAEHWVDIAAMDDEAAARRIVDDGIDILVDLNGHTRDARTAVLSMRPAPVIVNWLGYPGTMGTPYHHYIVADPWIVPEDHEIYYSETVLRLPCYQPNDSRRMIGPATQTRADVGLPEGATVFCCFNSAHKVTRFTFERWMRILQAVPDSVLWLFETAAATSRRLRAAAGQYGVAPDRLIFAPKLSNAAHLARYTLADLFLDTSPYGAHTTGSDALWMGLPVLTLSGYSFASRVCGSLVRAAGLPELVCTSPEEYVARAIALGNDRQELARLRERLAAQRAGCVLFDMERLVRSLEELYGRMWDDFRADRLPVPNLANLDTYLEIGAGRDFERTEMPSLDEYHGFYRRELARRHRVQPIADDGRLWTGAHRHAG